MGIDAEAMGGIATLFEAVDATGEATAEERLRGQDEFINKKIAIGLKKVLRLVVQRIDEVVEQKCRLIMQDEMASHVQEMHGRGAHTTVRSNARSQIRLRSNCGLDTATTASSGARKPPLTARNLRLPST